MSAAELIATLEARDIELWFEGDRLRFRAPKNALDVESRTRLGAERAEVLAALRERAAAQLACHPLSYGQRSLWVLHQVAPCSAAYNVALSARLMAPLDPAAMHHAAQALVDRHAVLRTTYGLEGDSAWQRVAGTATAQVQQHAAEHLDAAALRERVLADYRQPFDLASGPVCRFSVYTRAPQEHVLLLTVHHIAADGWTLLLMMEEFAKLYAEAALGTPAKLERTTLQYAECTRLLEEQLAGAEGERQWDHWRRQLEAPPTPPELPTDRSRPAVPTLEGATAEFALDAALTEALSQLARREGTTPFVLLLAAFHALLHRLSGAEDLIIGTPAFGRPKQEFMRVAGCFVNSVPARARPLPQMSFRALLAQVRQTMLGALDTQDYPLSLLVQRLGVERDASRSPLFDVMFALQRFDRFKAFETLLAGRGDRAEVEIHGLRLRPYLLPQQEGQFDLSMGMVEVDGQLVGALKYSSAIFSAATAQRLTEQYAVLLADIVRRPQACLAELNVLTAAEQQCMLLDWNDTAAPYPAEATVHGLFEAQVARSPAATALVFEDQALSYDELNQRANRIAHGLRSLGVARGALVGIWLERSVDMVASVLAVLKAGAAYVPLDPAFPQERIDYMMGDAALAAVVTQESLRTGKALTAPVLCVDGDAARLAGFSTANLPADGNSSDLAYVIYTSGSTGRPKGVMLEHRSVVNFLVSMQREPGISAQDRFVSVTTLSFDIAGLEIHGPLTCGGTVVLASRATALDGPALAALLRRHDATLLQATPTTWRLLLDSGWQGHTSPHPHEDGTARGLKMLCGGEALPRDLAERLLALPGALWNLYGPTETTIWSTLARVRSLAQPIAIGRPIANTQAYVLDPAGRPMPLNVPGELCLAGDGLARGYFNRPELTAEKFVTVELPLVGRTRVYRTGDVARWRDDGLLEYTGRRDHQIKLRGFRIELGEIEAVLAHVQGVARAVCLVREDRPGDQRLVAYVVAGSSFSADEARAALHAKLPEYMVPNLFVPLPALPLTPNGKIDRKALPAPLLAAPSAADGAPSVVMNATELRVAAAWCVLLGLPRVGLTDNFFGLGGHSMLLAKLHARLQRDFAGHPLALMDLFQHTTVRAQAALLSRAPIPEAARELLERLLQLGIKLTVAEGERLKLDAPKGVVDDVLRQEIVAHKAALVQMLKAASPEEASPAHGSGPPALPAVPRGGPLAVSHMQQRLWFLKQLDPGNAAYNVPCAMRFQGRFELPLMQRCLDDLVQRHEGLRTRFMAVDGEPRCLIEPQATLPVRHEDLSNQADATVREALLDQSLRRFATQPFDLASAPLARALWVRLAPDEVVLCLVLDHIVADGLSIAVLTSELRHLYTARHGGGPEAGANLPPLPAQYVDLIAWQEREFARGRLAEHQAFWTTQLAGLPELLSLTTDRPRPPVVGSRGARVRRAMAPSLVAEVRRMSREARATNFMVLLAAFMVLLQRHSGMVDIPVGTAVGNRLHPHAAGVVGFFANNIVLRGDLSGEPTVREYLARVREMCLASMAHQEMPFDRLVEMLVKRRGTDHAPLFQVQFVLQNFTAMELPLPGAVGKGFALDAGTARYDISVDLLEDEQRLDAYFEYNTDLFEADTIERMAAQYEALLADLVRRPEARLSELGGLSAADAACLRTWNDTAAPYPAEATVHGLFEAQVARSPAATALVFEDQALSYDELNQRANRIAHGLRSLGVARGALVGIWLERSVDMVASVLAVLKAGAAYVPLDPAFPQERIDYMMGDAALAAVVTQESLRTGKALTAPVLCVDGDAARLAGFSTANLPADGNSSDLAYVIYTSGSTGRPKGVMLEHRSVVNFLVSMQREPGISAQDRFVSVTTLSFDIAGLEIHGPLTCGGTVVLASRATALDGPALAALLRRHDATLLQATPTTWRLLLDSGWQGHTSPHPHEDGTARGLKMLCGGEALPRDLAERLLALPGALWNLYGPTETTIWSTLARVRSLAQPIAIGRPIANTRVHVLDAHGQPTPVGVAGELAIAGDGLARGYLGRKELTAEKFVTLDLPGAGTTRVYRTGDVARWRADGQLEFAGRRDQQVKLRGFRIELGEIEAVLAGHPGVSQSVVQVREDRPGDQRLVAYVVAKAAFEVEAARATLRARLPDYMVPNLFVTLAALPVTPNGKLDRQALPAPRWQAPASDDPGPEMVMSPAEQRVATAWRELLGAARVGLQDNFFDLGGHSLLLVKLQARLQRDFAVDLPLLELFQRTTVQSQAERLERASVRTDDAALQRARARADKVRRASHA